VFLEGSIAVVWDHGSYIHVRGYQPLEGITATSRITYVFRHRYSIVTRGDVSGVKNMVWSLSNGGEVAMTQLDKYDMTNLEDGYVARIKCGMYHIVCEHAVANIVNIIESCHILAVLWTILYDEPKPLK
jgi:hypothetical protein